MNNTTVSDGQNLLDVALQELGGLGALFDLADANGLSITDLLLPGAVLAVPDSTGGAPAVVGYFSSKRLRVNTGDKAPLAVPGDALPAPSKPQLYFSNNFFNPNTYA